MKRTLLLCTLLLSLSVSSIAQKNIFKGFEDVIDKVKTLADDTAAQAIVKGTTADIKEIIKDIQGLATMTNSELQRGKDSLSIVDPETSDYGWKDKISIVFAAGPTLLTERPWNDPVVDKTSNLVKMDLGTRARGNASFGITYTPKLYSFVRTVPVSVNGKQAYKNLYNYCPMGWSFGLFINPIALNATGDIALAQNFDAGLGFGWRTAGGFSVYGTLELYHLRQPRQSFINNYSSGDSTYRVNNLPQTTIDTKDESIFENHSYVAFGLKFAYAFNTVKTFANISLKDETDKKGTEVGGLAPTDDADTASIREKAEKLKAKQKKDAEVKAKKEAREKVLKDMKDEATKDPAVKSLMDANDALRKDAIISKAKLDELREKKRLEDEKKEIDKELNKLAKP